MGKLYAIAISDIAREREVKLSNLLGEEVSEYKPEYFVTKSYSTESRFTSKTRSFKTIRGASNEVEKLNAKFAGKQMRYPTARMVNGVYAYYFIFDASLYSFTYIDVTDRWNEMVNIDIEKENIRHSKEIIKLSKKLIK